MIEKKSLFTNPAIFQTMVVINNNIIAEELNVTVNNVSLPSSDTMKVLGTAIDDRWTSGGHVSRPEGNWMYFALQWRNNGREGFSNHRRLNCLLNCLFRRRFKENTKALRHWPLWGKFTDDKGPVTRKRFPFDDVIMDGWRVLLTRIAVPGLIIIVSLLFWCLLLRHRCLN